MIYFEVGTIGKEIAKRSCVTDEASERFAIWKTIEEAFHANSDVEEVKLYYHRQSHEPVCGAFQRVAGRDADFFRFLVESDFPSIVKERAAREVGPGIL